MEEEVIRKHVQNINGDATKEKYLTTLYQLSYHLCTLLHRNDCLGMAASIEARFPYLDSNLVKLAVNMPYNCKVRFSPTTFEKQHPFMRVKWVLREVAARYIPPVLSQRRKMGFHTSAPDCMKVKTAFFYSSFIHNLFGMTKQEIQYMIDHSNQKLKLKLIQLEV